MAGYPGHWEFDEIYDAIDRGCGDFIMDLRAVVRALPPEGRLLIVSHDAGAPREIPAWCRLTGHRLLETEPPYYLVVKRRP